MGGQGSSRIGSTYIILAIKSISLCEWWDVDVKITPCEVSVNPQCRFKSLTSTVIIRIPALPDFCNIFNILDINSFSTDLLVQPIQTASRPASEEGGAPQRVLPPRYLSNQCKHFKYALFYHHLCFGRRFTGTCVWDCSQNDLFKSWERSNSKKCALWSQAAFKPAELFFFKSPIWLLKSLDKWIHLIISLAVWIDASRAALWFLSQHTRLHSPVWAIASRVMRSMS